MTTKFLNTWKRRTNQLKMEAYAIYLAYKDPRVPWYAKILIVCVVGYAFSPIDKFLNSIPIIGYLDHLILGPAGCCIGIQKDDPVSGFNGLPRNSHEIERNLQTGVMLHHHVHLVSVCIVGNRFHNMGYQRLESGSRAVVQVVYTDDIHFRIKCALAKK